MSKEEQVIMLKKKMRISSSSAIDHHHHLFDLLPEEVIVDQILLKLPVESLLSLRCVCNCLRRLITSPSFVQLHTQQLLAAAHDDDDDDDYLILFSILHVQDTDDMIRTYICKFSGGVGGGCAADDDDHHRDTSRPETTFVEMHCPFPFTDIRASCNGLLYVHGRPICTENSKDDAHCCFSKGYVFTSLTKVTNMISPSYIWNPCTKEYIELPPPPPSTLLKHQQVVRFDDLWNDRSICSNSSNCNSFGFCGFGYDCVKDDYKILYYEYLVTTSTRNIFSKVATTEFKVYTLGTNTWTSISDNPYKSLFFGIQWLRIGLFVSGTLHWIMSSDCRSRCATEAKIISFDIEKEMFQEIQKPPGEEERGRCYANLQMLQGCLCVCQFLATNNLEEKVEEVDIWMLKNYTMKDSWTKFLRVAICHPNSWISPFRYFKLIRYCDNGEIAMLTSHRDLVLYNPFYHTATPAEKYKEDVKGYWQWQYQMNCRKSLVSLNSGTYS